MAPTQQPIPDTLYDAHAAGAGYLASPRDGTVVDLVGRIHELERRADVIAVRRLGVSIEHSMVLRATHAPTMWGTGWFDRAIQEMRSTLLLTEDFDGATVVDAMAASGAGTLCLGSTLQVGDIRRLVAQARAARLRVAVEPGPGLAAACADRDTIDYLRTHGSVEWLVDALLPDGGDRHKQRLLVRLGQTHARRIEDQLDAITDSAIPMVPLLVATRRRADLASAVEAPHIDGLIGVLPYHERVRSLRAPGAMRMGRREAMAHLGLVNLDRSQTRDLQRGWDRLGEVLVRLAARGHPLAGGSGAPGLGMCPGFGLRDEKAQWRLLGIADDLLIRAFVDAARALGSDHQPTALSGGIQ